MRYKFLFIHTAKTGGTSVRDALGYYKWADPWRLPQFLCSKLSGATGHRLGIKFPRHAKAIAAREMLPRELYESLFKFAFVRNPWDLQVSSYHHIRRERPHLVEHIGSFDEFLSWKFSPERPYQFHADTSIELQSDYVVDLHGAIIVDYIGRYEILQEDFDRICMEIGIRPRELPHRRRAGDRDADYRSYYTDAAAERVATHFARDIELFEYDF
jgi:hypothetical protein